MKYELTVAHNSDSDVQPPLASVEGHDDIAEIYGKDVDLVIVTLADTADRFAVQRRFEADPNVFSYEEDQ